MRKASCVDYLKCWLDLRVGDDLLPIHREKDDFLRTYGRSVEYLRFMRHACIIQKAYRHPVRLDTTGPALVPDTGDVNVQLTVHVSMKGDVICPEGFINLGIPIQGIEINSPIALHYRVAVEGVWGEWRDSGFAGTKGEERQITGVQARLADDVRNVYRLILSGKFREGDAPPLRRRR